MDVFMRQYLSFVKQKQQKAYKTNIYILHHNLSAYSGSLKEIF
jgi:hypothetical protein